jgi:hypothetical protein
MDELFFSHDTTSVLWLVLLGVLLFRAWFFSKPVAGLALCHWFSQAINHFFGEFFINQNAVYTSVDRNAGQIGYQISAWAICGLFLAFFTVCFYDVNGKNIARDASGDLSINSGFSALLYGFICYFFLSGLLSFIPSITSVLSGGLSMAAAGMAWMFLVVYKTKGAWVGLLFSSLMFLFPIFTLILNGFMGYGISAIFGVAGVVMTTFRPRWVIALMAPAILFLGLSLYRSYMLARGEIRSKVWGGAEIGERFDATIGGLSQNWQWFDPNDEKQMELLNGRMNQNVLVGYSQEYLSAGKASFGEGDTILDGFFALIPRVIWADKPLSAGSNGLVTRYTGINFAADTSVGIGNLMEFYVNFGVYGVLVGYFFIGLAIYYLDSKCGEAIGSMDAQLFFLCLVPGQALMNANGSFVEWGPSFFGAGVLVWVFLRYVKPPGVVKWRTVNSNNRLCWRQSGFERQTNALINTPKNNSNIESITTNNTVVD